MDWSVYVGEHIFGFAVATDLLTVVGISAYDEYKDQINQAGTGQKEQQADPENIASAKQGTRLQRTYGAAAGASRDRVSCGHIVFAHSNTSFQIKYPEMGYFNNTILVLFCQGVKIVKRLKLLRKKRHLSQLGLATALDMSQNSISRYENGEREADYQTLIAFADYFNVSIDYLLERTDNPEVNR